MGVRSSWARSLENSCRRAKSACRRASMVLRLSARSANSTGTASTGMRWSSFCAVTVMARSFMMRSGARPRRAAHQPNTPLTRMAPSE
ncbi:hypothetical protein FQZ97_1220510 [compost metagenome]